MRTEDCKSKKRQSSSRGSLTAHQRQWVSKSAPGRLPWAPPVVSDQHTPTHLSANDACLFPDFLMRTTPSLFNSPGPLLATRKQYLEVKWVSGHVKEGWWIARALSGPWPRWENLEQFEILHWGSIMVEHVVLITHTVHWTFLYFLCHHPHSICHHCLQLVSLRLLLSPFNPQSSWSD